MRRSKYRAFTGISWTSSGFSFSRCFIWSAVICIEPFALRNAMSEHIVSAKIYLVIFAALLVMTIVTYEVSLLDLGRLNVIVALTIAVIKAVLVVLYFMHVRYSSRLTWV